MGDDNIQIIKQELDWYIVREYLESIRTFCPLFRDEKFSKMYEEMREYVEEKTDVPDKMITTYYVAVECKDYPY